MAPTKFAAILPYTPENTLHPDTCVSAHTHPSTHRTLHTTWSHTTCAEQDAAPLRPANTSPYCRVCRAAALSPHIHSPGHTRTPAQPCAVSPGRQTQEGIQVPQPPTADHWDPTLLKLSLLLGMSLRSPTFLCWGKHLLGQCAANQIGQKTPFSFSFLAQGKSNQKWVGGGGKPVCLVSISLIPEVIKLGVWV